VAVAAIVQNLVSNLSQLQGLVPKIATLAGLVARVGQMVDAIERLEKESRYEKQNQRIIEDHNLILENVDVTTPNSNVKLISNLNLVIKPSYSTIIMGPSGVGKSSLLRVIGGLWPTTGIIRRPLTKGKDGIFFLPQRPYIISGNLRSQIIYPDNVSIELDTQLKDILTSVKLDYLLDRCTLDDVLVWEDILSPGEQQRLAFARLFYHRPRYAIMDESTSALDIELEDKLLTECLNLGITLISVAHRPSVIKYHVQMLKLDHDGNHKITNIDQ